MSNAPVSLRPGWRIPQQLSGQLQVALVQCAMFDGVQERITQRHRRFIEGRVIARLYLHHPIQLFVGQRRQQALHCRQPPFIACCERCPGADRAEFGEPVALHIVPSSQLEDPVFSGADEMGCQHKCAVALWKSKGSIEVALGEVPELVQRSANDAFKDRRKMACFT